MNAVMDNEARQLEANRQDANLRSVERLERAVSSWKSCRKIEGADDSLLNAVQAFKEAFNA